MGGCFHTVYYGDFAQDYPPYWEWMQTTKERERQENTNPVTRYLDRRRNERGGTFIAQYHLPWHPYFIWMGNSHDPDYPEYHLDRPGHPHLHWKEPLTTPF